MSLSCSGSLSESLLFLKSDLKLLNIVPSLVSRRTLTVDQPGYIVINRLGFSTAIRPAKVAPSLTKCGDKEKVNNGPH